MSTPVARTVVYMLVRNSCTHDARVLKEADALSRRGLRVTIIAVQRDGAPPREQRGQVTILRVPIRPLHYRILRRYRSLPRLDTLLARRRRRKRLAEARRTRRQAAQKRAHRLERARTDRDRALHERLEVEVLAAVQRTGGAGRGPMVGRSRHPLTARVAARPRRPGMVVAHAAASARVRELRARASLAAEHGISEAGARACDRLPAGALDSLVVMRGRVGVATAKLGARFAALIRPISVRHHRERTATVARAASRASAATTWLGRRARSVRRLAGRAGARVRALAAAAFRPLGRLRSRIRPAVYDALRWTLMRAHRQFLLADYSARALETIESDLAQVTERGERGAVVIHAHDLNTLVPGVRGKRRFEAMLVYDSHELQLGTTGMMARSRPHRWLYKVYERTLSRRADAVITVCQSIAEILERGYGITHVDVVRNCPLLVPPLDRHDLFRREQGIAAESRIALYHGNLSPGRGLEVLVESAKFMDRVDVILLGSGPLLEELPRIAAELGVSDRVRVLPAVRQNVLHRYVASADVAVVPIQGEIPNYYYSLPNKLFEAMMAGLPIAASHLPEIRRVVEEERVGAIFDPDDPRDVARGITAVLDSPDYREMRQRAVVAARERHHWGREVERLAAVYDRLSAHRTG